MLLNRVSVSSKRRLTLAKKTSVFIKQSLCLNQTGHLYMFDFTIRILYAVMSQPCPKPRGGSATKRARLPICPEPHGPQVVTGLPRLVYLEVTFVENYLSAKLSQGNLKEFVIFVNMSQSCFNAYKAFKGLNLHFNSYI